MLPFSQINENLSEIQLNEEIIKENEYFFATIHFFETNFEFILYCFVTAFEVFGIEQFVLNSSNL